MTEFDKTRWAEKDFAHEYLDAADIQIVERRRLLEILKSFYRYFLKDGQTKKVLDLGCGDGILTHEILKIDPTIEATLVDGSSDMLEEARKKLDGFKGIHFIKANFQEMLDSEIRLPDSDLVVSSLAIHHLSMAEKTSLFNYIYSLLGEGGYFFNIDLAKPTAEAMKEWYLRLWEEWISEKQAELNLEEDLMDIIQNCTEDAHYRNLDTLEDQMDALEKMGFKEVDCYFKYGIFAIYGGRR